MYRNNIKLIETASIKPELQHDEYKQQIKDGFIKLNDYWLDNIDSLPMNTNPNERQSLISIAFLSIGQLSRIYYDENKYDSAIYLINQFLIKAEPKGSALMSSKLNLARIYQASGDFEKAMTIYSGLIDTFYPPVDNEGNIVNEILNLPIEIVKIYTTLGNDEPRDNAIVSAENYYKRLLSDWSNSALSTAAYGNLARLYYDEKRWDESISSLSKMTDSTGNIGVEVSMMIAAILSDGKKDYDGAIELYQDLLGKVDDSLKTPTVMLRLAISHYNKKEYSKTEDYISQIKDNYQYFFRINPLPQNYFALSNMNRGNWNRAESEFQYLIDFYASSEAAFNAFLIVSDHYRDEKNKMMADNWMRRAEEFYKEMGVLYAGTNVEASSLSFMAEVARKEGRWMDAIGYLESIFDKFPQSEIGQKAMIMAAGVYKDKLNDEKSADSLINRLKAELFPVSDGKKNDIITDDKL